MEQQAETVQKKRFNIGIVGVGQGGSSLTQTMCKKFGIKPENTAAINLSDSDLRAAGLIPESNRILLDANRFGAGKNREVSKSYIVEKQQFILDKLSEILSPEKGINLIFVVFSTDGGTGSGIGPFLTALLESNKFEKCRGALVFGIPLLPDQAAGKLGLANTIPALKEISNLSEAKAARYLLVDNNSGNSKIKDPVVRWQEINENVCKLLKRYLMTSYVSKSSNLDFEDRYVSLKVPGCHSLLTYQNADAWPTLDTCFVLPEGARVSNMASEIPEGSSEVRGKLISAVGCTVDEPNMVGYYEEGEEGAIPIVHFAGFSNLAKVTERYQSWFSEIRQKAEAAARVDATKGNGFQAIEENAKWIESQSETNSEMSSEDLFNLMNG